jgi:hypothetical protein
MDRFDRFSERARKVLTLAQDEVGVSDDLGTFYVAENLDTSRVGNLLLGRTMVVPTPPAEADHLFVQVVRPPAGRPEEDWAASWHRFEVKLRD